MSAVTIFDSPYDLLVQMDRKCRSQAAGLPVMEETREEWVGVQFVLHGREMLASMSDVAEIVSLPTVTRIPGVKPWVMGMANMRGMLLPVIDLEGFLFGESARSVETQRRLLVVEFGEVFAGLVVENVIGMRHYWVDEKAAELPSWLDDKLALFVDYSFERGGLHVPVFNIASLVGDEAFMDVSV
jgi:twitching motility protein PilI